MVGALLGVRAGQIRWRLGAAQPRDAIAGASLGGSERPQRRQEAEVVGSIPGGRSGRSSDSDKVGLATVILGLWIRSHFFV
jgi:hypothetical protein